MKKTIARSAVALFTLAAGSVIAQSAPMPDMAHTGAAAAAMSSGVVKKLDKAAHRITLTHGPLQNLGMPGMTMSFLVRNDALLDKVKPGDAVRFVAENPDGRLTVTALEAAR